MDRSKKYIYGLGALIVLLSIVKHLTYDGNLPGTFWVFEFSSFMGVVIFVYYFLQVQNKKDKSISELNEKLAEQTKEHKQYIKAIKSELRQYHEAEKEEITFNTKKDKVIKKVNEIADKEKNSTIIGDEILKIISKYFEVSAGIAFSNDGSVFKAVKLFALEDDFKVEEFTPDEGIHGQVIKEYKPLKIDDIPEDYFTIFSGIGEAKPKFVYLLPIKINEKTSMLFELASFKDIKIIPLWKELLSERGSN